MGNRFELPAELNICSALETRDAMLARVPEQTRQASVTAAKRAGKLPLAKNCQARPSSCSKGWCSSRWAMMCRSRGGVINLRGAEVPLIDLQSRFGRSTAQVGKKSCIVIFDRVADIRDADSEPPPQFGTGIDRKFIRGMGKLGGAFIVILEPGRTLNVEEMASLTQISEGNKWQISRSVTRIFSVLATSCIRPWGCRTTIPKNR